MKRIEKAQLLLCVALLWFAQSIFASSNSNPGLYYGQIPTAGQWNSYFSSKLDYLPGTLNSIPYWDASGNFLYAPVSGDCLSSANVFTCATMGGYSFASPPPTGIGNVTPSPGAFTTLSASSTVSGTGFSTYLATPPAIGGTTPNSGAFTSLSATSLSLSSINNTPIGNTTPSTGAFTSITAQSGVVATGAYTASYTDGTVVDYQSGNGRISVGGADTLSFYSGGIGSSLMAKMTPASGVQITGTTTNDNAAAGYVGEYVSATAAVGSVSLTTSTPTNITSISLTAGDWDVSGDVAYSAAGTTSVTLFAQGISATSATLGALGTYTQRAFAAQVPGTNGNILSTSMIRISLAATTTIYLVAQSTFTVSTMTAGGIIRARRVR